jgi:hypothetical protein
MASFDTLPKEELAIWLYTRDMKWAEVDPVSPQWQKLMSQIF